MINSPFFFSFFLFNTERLLLLTYYTEERVRNRQQDRFSIDIYTIPLHRRSLKHYKTYPTVILTCQHSRSPEDNYKPRRNHEEAHGD